MSLKKSSFSKIVCWKCDSGPSMSLILNPPTNNVKTLASLTDLERAPASNSNQVPHKKPDGSLAMPHCGRRTLKPACGYCAGRFAGLAHGTYCRATSSFGGDATHNYCAAWLVWTWVLVDGSRQSLSRCLSRSVGRYAHASQIFFSFFH